MKNEYDFEVKNNTPPVSELRKQLQIGVWLFAFAAAAFLGGLQSMSLQVARALNEFSLGMCGGTADFLAAHLTNNFFVDNISTALTSALLVLVVYFANWQNFNWRVGAAAAIMTVGSYGFLGFARSGSIDMLAVLMLTASFLRIGRRRGMQLIFKVGFFLIGCALLGYFYHVGQGDFSGYQLKWSFYLAAFSVLIYICILPWSVIGFWGRQSREILPIKGFFLLNVVIITGISLLALRNPNFFILCTPFCANALAIFIMNPVHSRTIKVGRWIFLTLAMLWPLFSASGLLLLMWADKKYNLQFDLPLFNPLLMFGVLLLGGIAAARQLKAPDRILLYLIVAACSVGIGWIMIIEGVQYKLLVKSAPVVAAEAADLTGLAGNDDDKDNSVKAQELQQP